MPKLVCTTATLRCTMGAAPSTFVGTAAQLIVEGKLAGTVLDHKPMANVAPFGLCRSLANPTVASATSAAMGTLTPMPCVPNTPAPWTPGVPKLRVCGALALCDSDALACAWGGRITVTAAGQGRVGV